MQRPQRTAKRDVFSLALELGGGGSSIAWVIQLPGLFIERSSPEAAVEDAPGEIRRYLKWLRSHGEKIALPRKPIVSVSETVQFRRSVKDGMTSALFESDRKPVSQRELNVLLRRARFFRADLLSLLNKTPDAAWTWRPKRRSELASTYFPTVKEQAQHIAAAETWYVQKLWPVPKFGRAKTPLERIETVREFVVGILRERGVADSTRVVDVDGQEWSARKVLRRLLYHEPYHLAQIRKILHQYRQSER